MRPSPSPVAIKIAGYLLDFHSKNGGFDHHFGGEFHSRISEMHSIECASSESTHSTICFPHTRSKKYIHQKRQDRRSKIAMQERVGSFFDFALKSVPHH